MGGGKLNRTVTVTVRLTPELTRLMEQAANQQGRTKSSYIEYVVKMAVKKPCPTCGQNLPTARWQL